MKMPGLSTISNPVCFLSLIMPLVLTACSSDSSDSTTTNPVTTEVASLDNKVKNVDLDPGVQAQIKFGYTIPGDISTKGDFSINLTETLKNTSLSTSPVASSSFETLRLLAYALVKNAFAADEASAQVTAYISYAGDPDVCSSPYKFGPYSISGMVDSALSSDTESVTPSAAAVDITNAGSFDVCIVTTPPIDAFLTVTGVAVDFEECVAPAADFVGDWQGTYQCINFDDSIEESAVNVTITQNTDGSYKYTDDAGAVYNGHVCGNKFKFKGGLDGAYTESGTMTAEGSSATKTSLWLSVFDNSAGGRYTDNLDKI